MLSGATIEKRAVKQVPLAILAHLGDAVFDLHERERQVLHATSTRQLHGKVVLRVSAGKQAELLDTIVPHLTDEEQELVRMARNLKPSGYRKAGQAAYRKSTAFEALIGFLYLTDKARLRQVFEWTLTTSA